MEPQTTNPVGKLFGLLKRRHVAFGMAAVMLTYAGVFASFTYLRPFLERYTHVSLPQLSLLLLGLGLAGFAGTYGATALVGRHLFSLLCGLPMAFCRPLLVTCMNSHVYCQHGLLFPRKTDPSKVRQVTSAYLHSPRHRQLPGRSPSEDQFAHGRHIRC
jgi:predicted MFS family arabinose efflux permease